MTHPTNRGLHLAQMAPPYKDTHSERRARLCCLRHQRAILQRASRTSRQTSRWRSVTAHMGYGTFSDINDEMHRADKLVGGG